jgi:hypothetical protein
MVAVTGSVAANAVTPTAVGGQLMVYLPPGPEQQSALDRVAERLGLLRTESGANVLLLRAADPVVFVGRREVDGLDHVALSQLALDSLGGTGRMPAEGEAVIDYMSEHPGWRKRSLNEWRLLDPRARTESH